jgi:hypothetical protein
MAARLTTLDDPLIGSANRDSYMFLRQDILDWTSEDT